MERVHRAIHSRRPRGLAGLCILTVLLSLLAATAPATAREVMAPAFQTVTLSGEAWSTNGLDGHPALLIFWAPWCKVCQRELPAVREFYEHEKPSSLRVLAVGFADTRASVEEFVTSRGAVFAFPTAYDDGNRIAREYRINATPTYVLIDGQGRVALIHRGAGLLQNVQFREFLSLLNQ
ncbi:TlpA family protein disulfide reductase [Candidatus Nitrospira bockiana]